MQTNHVTDWQGKMLGRYRLIRLLGRGGMGEVWQAEDTELHRQVAAKVLPPVVANETDYLRAFAEEARTAASLEHAHILQVHDFGEEPSAEDVVTYLVMPLITGGSLRDRIRANKGLLPVAESLHYLLQAAQAIDYAHSKHVLHRDIKPANMLLQQDWLFLADFGIAKLLSTTTHRSRTHAGAGTPEYMAPEQVQGKAEAASDRYSLAVIAYQLFSAHLPFTGQDTFTILLKQMQEAPTSPRQFNADIPAAVEGTLLRALAKEPAARPTSCVAFVDELTIGWKLGAQVEHDPEATLLAPWNKRYIENQSTQLAPPSTPGTNGDALSSAPSLNATYMERSTSTPAPPLSYGTVPPPATQIPEQFSPSEHMQRIGRRGLLIAGASTVAVVAAGGAALAAYLHSRSTSVATPRPPPGPYKLIAGVPLLRFIKHDSAIWNVAWHSEGRFLATGSADTHLMLWDVGSSLKHLPVGTPIMQKITTPLHNWKFAGQILSDMMGWSADGHTLAVIPESEAGNSLARAIHMINDQQDTSIVYTNKSPKDPFDHPLYTNLAWSPTQDLLAVSTYSQLDVTLWKRGNTNGPIKTLKNTVQQQATEGYFSTQNLGWSHDGSMLAGVQDNFNIIVWNVQTEKVLHLLSLPPRSRSKNENSVIKLRRNVVSWSPQERNLLVTSNVDVATVWDAAANKLLFSLATNDPDAYKVAPVPNGDRPSPPQINGLAWSPNGRYIAGSYEYSHKIYIWDTENKNPKLTKEGFRVQDLLFGEKNGHFIHVGSTIIDLAWSPDGHYLATASNDTTVIIWKVDGA